MKKDYCDINLILDRSGSMESIRDDTIGGVNTFLEEQKKLPGEATFSLFQFDHQYDVVVQNQPLSDVKPLSRETFIPRGSTALLDAIGETINFVGNKLSATPEDQRPEKVILAIITDGHENASVEFTKPKVFDMIKHQTEVYNWEFVYLGANQDAISIGTSFGLAATSCCSYDSTGDGTKSAFESLGKYSSTVRSGNKGSF